MSGKYNNFQYFFDELQNKVNEFIHNKNSFKQKLKDFVFTIQMIDSRIQKALFIARDFNFNQRKYYKQKIDSLKKKVLKNEQSWTRLTNEMKDFASPKLDTKISEEIEFLKNSIRDMNLKISNLNFQLENLSLGIDVEDKITEELVKLQAEEKIESNKLVEMEKSLEQKFQSSKYYQTKRKIENLELSLTESYINIRKWSDRLLTSHKKMLNLYRIARDFDYLKSKITVILSDNKDTSIYYNQLYIDLIDENYRNTLEELLQSINSRKLKVIKEKETPDMKQQITPQMKQQIKKRKYSKKKMEQKLALALKKQKSGKKLDFYELKLILEHSKKSN